MLVSTGGVEATRALARAVASVLRGGDVVVLAGEMGAGKTAFTQGLAAALGVDGPVTSPTFTLVRSYPAPSGLTLHHLDIYRLDRLGEVADLALEELIDRRSITVIEWGDVISGELPGDRLDLYFTFGDEPDDREIELDCTGASWRSREERLADAVGAVV
jgi:tRNA threonylcarbamoyladenosine biosynthesis protein TsaE